MAYNPVAVSANEDATLDYLRAADLSGVAVGTQFTFAFHVRFNMAFLPSAIGRIVANTGIRYGIWLTTGGHIQFTFTDTTPTTLLTARTNNNPTTIAANTPYSIIIEGDISTASQSDIRMWINDVQQTLTFVTGPINGNIQFPATNHSVFATTTGATPLNADLADFRMFLSRIDSTVVANRRLFFDASNALVKPSTDGSVVVAGTGTVAPIVFFGGDGVTAATWQTNKGTGGGYNVQAGALGTSGNPPAGVDPPGGGMVFSPPTQRFQHMLVR